MKVVAGLSDKVYHFHLHDIRATDWREHRAVVGEGIIDFQRLFRYLKECSYSGLMTFEMEEEDNEDALIKSIDYVEKLMRNNL